MTRTADPLGGSYYVEALTDQMEKDALDIIHEIDDMGGVIGGITRGYFRRSIAEASYRFGQEMERGERLIVGVNAYVDENEVRDVEILQIGHKIETDQVRQLADFKLRRNQSKVDSALDGIREAARNDVNVMPSLVEGADANCTLGEMVQAMADVFGRYSGGPEW